MYKRNSNDIIINDINVEQCLSLLISLHKVNHLDILKQQKLWKSIHYSSFEGMCVPALVKGKLVADKFSLFLLKSGCVCRYFVHLGTGNKDQILVKQVFWMGGLWSPYWSALTLLVFYQCFSHQLGSNQLSEREWQAELGQNCQSLATSRTEWHVRSTEVPRCLPYNLVVRLTHRDCR